MTEQPLNLRFVLSSIRRQRMVVLIVLIVGLGAGMAYGVVRPPLPNAKALVLLPPSGLTSAGTPTRDMTTQMVIATSTPVLTSAGRAVSPPIAPGALKQDVTVTALSQDVLQVKVHYHQPRDAVLLANAVASSYIHFVTTAPTSATEQGVAGLQAQASRLSHQIQGLQGQINQATQRLANEGSSSPRGQQDTLLVQSLRSQQDQVTLELDDVNSQISAAQLSTSLTASGTSILQSASSATPGSKLAYVVDVLIGAAIALLLGIVVALVRSRHDGRLRLRADFSTVAGAPVLGSFQAQGCRSTDAWRRLLEGHTPTSVEISTVRRLLRNATGGPSTRAKVQVVAFADDDAALAATVQMALAASATGIPTSLVPAPQHPSLTSLRAVGMQEGSRIRLAAVDQIRDIRDAGGLIVSLAVVDRNDPQPPATDDPTVVAISSGMATADEVARLALAYADARHEIAGLLVVNPDRSDDTIGATQEPASRPPSPQKATAPLPAKNVSLQGRPAAGHSR